MLVVCAALLAVAGSAACQAMNGGGSLGSSPYYVISAAAQAGSGQPYARGCQNRVVNLTVGTGSAAVAYQFAVDTGSSLLEISCQSAAAQANCGGRALSSSFELTPGQTISSAEACATTGIDCFIAGAAGQPSMCYFSQGLTGGTGYIGRHGVFAQAPVTATAANSSTGGALQLPNATVACAQSTWSCGEFDKACIATQEACPSSDAAGTLQGGCPQDGMGYELGFTFALPGSQQAAAASAVSLPEQAYQAGLIQERVLGVCWQPPQKDSNCSAALAPNSAVVLGSVLPLAVPSLEAMQEAPLIQDPQGTASASGAASTNKFRSAVQGASVPVYGSDTPWSANYSSGANGSVTVLWDTGAEGMLMVPSDVFAAFQAYYTAASQQVKANSSFTIAPCNASTFCGHSTPSGSEAGYACQSIQLPADASADTLAAAQQALLSMYPPSVDVLLKGGATAGIPGAVLVNDCKGPDYLADVWSGSLPLHPGAGVALCIITLTLLILGVWWCRHLKRQRRRRASQRRAAADVEQGRPRRSLAALLLLTSAAAARAAPAAAWPLALDEDDICPPIPAATVQAFTEGTSALTKGTAANLACHLNLLLGRYDAGNATAEGQLRAMYRAWRDVHRPQRWHAARASKANWLASLRYIASVNTLMSNKWWAGLNSYSDLSAQEFAATVLQTSAQAGVQQAATSAATASSTGSTSAGARKLLARYVPPPVSYPLTINWATAGRVLPQVSFQGQCASSWAFAAASALESRLMIGASSNTTAALSAQHIMDCTAAMSNYSAPSCTGGSPADAFAFAATTGVATDDGYPYRGLNGNSADAPGRAKQCDRGFLTGQAAKQGTVHISGTPAFTPVHASKLGLITALAAQPLVASVGVDPSFQHYAGGIWSSPDCDASVPAQVMLVIGYDVNRYGQEHFIAKNSLGAAWGEGGSMRIAMSDTPAGTCGLYLRALQPGAVTTLAAAKPGNGKGSGKV
ncbi:ervatamin-B-like isoform X2 [Chlorella sorokiniana]|uniref:Ervatamin-B-like isoform X2 n=1 Tax=Chlorella sorokiniana TaxID=3076 RepID=A0A2P6TJZ3_CHLSO|nr:ervatamin-B-like isoform X2 [Chlorella sorokiniana]|eukprot:PRW44397.1 ervatamin-B-like isoform X2 [Chlorella sorokiniana]